MCLQRVGGKVLQVKWIKCEEEKWCSLKSVNLSHEHFDGMAGVYMIFYLGSPGKVVRVGQGDIADRLSKHRNDPEITAYGGLLATWAKVPEGYRDGVEKYLADTFEPLVGDRFPDRQPIAINSPFN